MTMQDLQLPDLPEGAVVLSEMDDISIPVAQEEAAPAPTPAPTPAPPAPEWVPPPRVPAGQPPIVEPTIHEPLRTQPAKQQFVDKDFIAKLKVINNIDPATIEQRLDEIDAMFSLRRNTKGAARSNASVMLAISLWEVMGL